MPLLTAQKQCGQHNPCRRGADRCARCNATDNLTDTDWYLVEFYRTVADQYINQTPMGAGEGQPMHLTPRLEGYEAALRIGGYPRELWRWLTHWAKVLHRFHRGLEKLPQTPEQRAHMASLGVK